MKRPFANARRGLRLLFLSATLFLIAAMLAAPAFAGSATASKKTSALDTYIQQQMSAGHMAGLGVAIIKDGRVQLIRGYGYQNIEKGKRYTPDTIQNIGSISKTFTAAADMQLVERHKLSLDGDLSDVLGFSLRNPYFPSYPITLRMVLAMSSSALDNWDAINSTVVQDMEPLVSLRDFSVGYFQAGGAFNDPTQMWDQTSPPDTKATYCNAGFALAGYLAEKQSGKSFEQYTEQKIFDPLGMKATAWHRSDLLPKYKHLWAGAYRWNADTQQFDNWGYWTFADYPDGALLTSTRQLSRWLTVFMNDGTYTEKHGSVRILRHSTVDAMLTEHISRYGLGFRAATVPNAPSRYAWGKSGSYAGSQGNVIFEPATGEGIVILSNSSTLDPWEEYTPPWAPDFRAAWNAIQARLWQEADAL